MSVIHRFSLHKYLIQSLYFFYNEKYLVSLGGAEDNYLIVWDVETSKVICGNTAGTDLVHQVKFFNKKMKNYNLSRLWNTYMENRLESKKIYFYRC